MRGLPVPAQGLHDLPRPRERQAAYVGPRRLRTARAHTSPAPPADQRLQGFSMRVERSSVSAVKSRLKAHKRRREQQAGAGGLSSLDDILSPPPAPPPPPLCGTLHSLLAATAQYERRVAMIQEEEEERKRQRREEKRRQRCVGWLGRRWSPRPPTATFCSSREWPAQEGAKGDCRW